MIWIGVTAALAIGAELVLIGFAVRQITLAREMAQSKAQALRDAITKKLEAATQQGLEAIARGQDPYLIAQRVRAEVLEIVPARGQGLPQARDMSRLCNELYERNVAAPRRSALTRVLGGSVAIGMTALLICALLYQFAGPQDQAVPAAAPVRPSYTQPVFP